MGNLLKPDMTMLAGLFVGVFVIPWVLKVVRRG